ncbi:MAG TPA: rhodanese-like domain-containing protein [Rubricoccaceae bacterium]|jgi:rhodanese-related sulfurtransferase
MSFLSRLFGGRAPSLSPAAFVAERDPAAPLLDVRTPSEFAGGHLRGAVNVDVTAPGFGERVARLGLPADAAVYVYCASGVRSGRAVGMLGAMGHAGAVNVGGYGALRAAGAE